jgi:hypothetical protein
MKFISQPAKNQHFNCDNVEDLMMFRKAFDFEELDREKVQKDLKVVFENTLDKTEENLVKVQTDFTFKIITSYYKPESAPSWQAKITFHVENAGDYSIAIKEGRAVYINGSVDNATCNIYTDVGTLATQLCILRLEDVREDDELSDNDLEMVSGGKNNGCGTNSCSGAACPEAICAAAVCGADACSLDFCSADACAGAACAVAIGLGACAGNACAVDVQGSVDVGPCAVNVLPGVPGI